MTSAFLAIDPRRSAICPMKLLSLFKRNKPRERDTCAGRSIPENAEEDTWRPQQSAKTRWTGQEHIYQELEPIARHSKPSSSHAFPQSYSFSNDLTTPDREFAPFSPLLSPSESTLGFCPNCQHMVKPLSRNQQQQGTRTRTRIRTNPWVSGKSNHSPDEATPYAVSREIHTEATKEQVATPNESIADSGIFVTDCGHASKHKRRPNQLMVRSSQDFAEELLSRDEREPPPSPAPGCPDSADLAKLPEARRKLRRTRRRRDQEAARHTVTSRLPETKITPAPSDTLWWAPTPPLGMVAAAPSLGNRLGHLMRVRQELATRFHCVYQAVQAPALPGGPVSQSQHAALVHYYLQLLDRAHHSVNEQVTRVRDNYNALLYENVC